MRRARWSVVTGAGVSLVAWLVACGCTSSSAPATGSAAASASAPAPVASASASASAALTERAADDIKPVYPAEGVTPDPLAVRFCDALHTLPGARAAACCGPGGGAAGTIAGECVRTLSYALSQHAVTLAAADVDRCVEAMTKATAGCDWVASFNGVATPPACDGIVKGALAEKAQCRSSLECQPGLRCQGLSTIDLGTCGPPKPVKSACNLAIDTLASYTRQDRVDRDHPECDGHCGRARCEPAVAEGGACQADVVCGSKARCVAGKCTSAPVPALGDACTAECAYGTRCVKGKCAAPKAEGDACEANEECRGACDRGDGGTAGRCQKSCPVVRLPILKNVAPPVAPKR